MAVLHNCTLYTGGDCTIRSRDNGQQQQAIGNRKDSVKNESGIRTDPLEDTFSDVEFWFICMHGILLVRRVRMHYCTESMQLQITNDCFEQVLNH